MTQNLWTNEKIIEFINEIHLKPALWDVNSTQYRDRFLKKDDWEEVAKKFYTTSSEAYKKFRSLRTYAKNEFNKLKSGSAGGRRKWFAFDAMSFILSRDIPDAGVDSLSTEESVIEGTESDYDEGLEGADTLTSPESLPNPARKEIPKSRKRRNMDAILEKAVNLVEDSDKNEFSSFGDHIARKLMSYSRSIRADVEFKISQILYRADKESLKDISSSSAVKNISNSSYHSPAFLGTSVKSFQEMTDNEIEEVDNVEICILQTEQ